MQNKVNFKNEIKNKFKIKYNVVKIQNTEVM